MESNKLKIYLNLYKRILRMMETFIFTWDQILYVNLIVFRTHNSTHIQRLYIAKKNHAIIFKYYKYV